MSRENLIFWLSWCIEEYAAENQLSATDVSAKFEENGVFDYLCENSEILHTQGKNYILGCIDDFLRQRISV